MSSKLYGLRFAAAAGVTVYLVGAGTIAGHALWTAQTAQTAAVSAATISASTSGLEKLSTSYTAGIPDIFPSELSHTTSVSLTNTGTAPLTFTMAISGGTASLNSQITVQVWKRASTCDAATAPDTGTSTSGTLAAPPPLNSAISTVEPAQTLTLCTRTNFTGTFPTSELSTTPTINFTGRVGTNWTTSTAPTTITQTTAFDWFQIVQSTTGKCLQAAGAGGTTGQDIVNADCSAPSNSTNQSFRLSATDSGYYRLHIGTGSGAVISGRPALFIGIIPSVVELVAPANGTTTAALRQQWQPTPHGASGDFRIINREANLCLTMPGTSINTTATITTCSNDTNTGSTAYRNQHFKLALTR